MRSTPSSPAPTSPRSRRTAEAYFKCVNDNGGINGRPVELVQETEQTDPAQAAAAAKKLVETEKVAGIVGSTSIIECAVNHKYYEENGYYVIGSGIAPECYGTSNYAAVNMGPRHSVTGATQYLIREGVEKLVLIQSKVPGTEYIEGGFLAARQAGGRPDREPRRGRADPGRELGRAEGHVRRPATAAAWCSTSPRRRRSRSSRPRQQQGLQDRVKWACSTPCNTDFLADALGTTFDDKLGVNAELALVSIDAPDTNLYKEILKKYAPDIPLGQLQPVRLPRGQDRHARRCSASRARSTRRPSTRPSRTSKDFKTDMLCKPYYYGEAPLHIPNNTDSP